VDTSAWVAFFRGDAAAVRRIDPLLAEMQVAVTGPIYAEVLSGARTRDLQQRLRERLRSLLWLREPPDVWERIAEVRFQLARLGRQASLVDTMIALIAAEAACTLLTRDRDFDALARVLPLEHEVF